MESIEVINDVSRLKSFSFYHAFILLSVAYVAIAGGATIGYNVFGQYIPDSICAEWEDQLDGHASKNFSELQIEIMKPKLIDAPYQHNCELAEEYSVLSNRTGCISYIYDHSIMIETIASKHNLVCRQTVFNSILTSTLFVGFTVGSALGGYLSDKYGRKFTFTLLMGLSLFGSFGLAFPDSLSCYQTMRMIQAVTLVGGFGPMLTYCFEICGDKHRSMIYVLMAGIPWSLGFGFIAYIADLTRHWWTTLAIFIGITIPFPLIYICTMPESYKFLIAKKRWADAKKSMKRFPKNKPADPHDEKINEKMIQEAIDDNFLEECDENLKFNWALKLSYILVLLVWVAVNAIFNGLYFFVAILDQNPFLNFYWSTLMDMLGYLILFFIINRMKRRVIMIFAFLVVSICTGATLIASQSMMIPLMLFSRLGACALYGTVSLIAAELFPTEVRSTLISIAVGISMLGGFVAPLITSTVVINANLPCFIFCLVSVAGMLCVMLLPETSDSKTLETIAQAAIFHSHHYKNLFKPKK